MDTETSKAFTITSKTIFSNETIADHVIGQDRPSGLLDALEHLEAGMQRINIET
jgi:hypothetical protein